MHQQYKNAGFHSQNLFVLSLLYEKNNSLFIFIIAAQISFAQTKISIDSISTHMSEQVQICSKVYGVKALDKVTFINLGAAYPNSPLTIVMFAKDLPNFKGTPEELYGNKQICVTDKLAEYKSKPHIVLTKPGEIILQ